MLAHEDKPLMLDIYSTREQAGRSMLSHRQITTILRKTATMTQRNNITNDNPYLYLLPTIGVEMIPTRKWGDGNGGLIGCSIRFCMFDAVNDVVWHILVIIEDNFPIEIDVSHNTPNSSHKITFLANGFQLYRMWLRDHRRRRQACAHIRTMSSEHHTGSCVEKVTYMTLWRTTLANPCDFMYTIQRQTMSERQVSWSLHFLTLNDQQKSMTIKVTYQGCLLRSTSSRLSSYQMKNGAVKGCWGAMSATGKAAITCSNGNEYSRSIRQSLTRLFTLLSLVDTCIDFQDKGQLNTVDRTVHRGGHRHYRTHHHTKW